MDWKSKLEDESMVNFVRLTAATKTAGKKSESMFIIQKLLTLVGAVDSVRAGPRFWGSESGPRRLISEIEIGRVVKF